ncbi:glycosyl hydrolase family 18 protein [Hymenobacter pini]|uniref:glycosyl hydrolase family 18 protein n=1 Tax=Hymenobacter pini TaxID=2880879 RepID=UPI001CF4FA85|nr:glycosyl hydrolase family 18 protein [Hymenobacter pini]MCA8829708.1 hypothetical protein [Hymenobacter pini]
MIIPRISEGRTRPYLAGLLLLILLGSSPQGHGQSRTARTPRPARAASPRPTLLADPALPVAPPSVQNYQRYSAADRAHFERGGYPPLPPAAAPSTGGRRLRPGAAVVGWHPAWMGNAYSGYNLQLLTHLAYYGYQANDLGQLLPPTPPTAYGPDSLVARVRQQKSACKVLLTISYPAAEGRNSLLNAERLPAQNRLLTAIVNQVVATGAHGVNLDFAPPDQQPYALQRLGRQLAAQSAGLRQQEQALAAEAQALEQQLGQLTPAPDSLLLLANDKDLLTAALRTTTQQQRALEAQIAVHLKNAPAPLPKHGLIWGTVVNWFDLDKQAKKELAQAQADYKKAGQALAVQKAKLADQEISLRQQLLENARLTRNYADKQLATQPERAATAQQRALTAEQQAANQTQQARKRQARLDVRRRAASYQDVVPLAMRPLTDHSRELQDFIARLAVRLWARDSAYQITLNVPAVDSTGTYRNLRAVQHLVSLFIIKAFDYTPYNQIVPGPLAPLKPGEAWGPHSVTTSVAYYLQQGTVPRRQLVVGFPHLGKVWQVDSLGGQRVGDLQAPQYWTTRQLAPLLPISDGKLDLTSLSQNASTLAPAQAGQPAPQAWWEDSVSLAPKYAWLLKQHLAGVGIWALGYEENPDQTWNLVRADFTEPVALPTASPPTRTERLAGIRHMLLFGAVVLIGFLLLGLLIATYRRAADLLEIPPLLVSVGLLIGLCSLCVVGYAFWAGLLTFSGWLFAGLGLGLLLLNLLLYRRYWRQQILP